MIPIHLQILIESQTPIAHHEGSEANHSYFMRRKVRMPDGSFSKIPIVTADSMRNLLRRMLAEFSLECAGLWGEGKSPQLTEGALRLLFAGGMLTGKGDAGVIKTSRWRELVDLVPSLSLFGGCVDAMVLPGKLSVCDLLLICDETKHLIPSWMVDYASMDGTLPSWRAQLEESQRVRMDPVRNPSNRNLLSPDAKARVESQIESREKAHEENDPVAEQSSKSSMMPRTYESIAQGSLWMWELSGNLDTDIDKASLYTALMLLSTARAHVGGKKGVGFGRIKPILSKEVQLPTLPEKLQSTDLSTLGVTYGKLFEQHLKDRSEKIKAILSEVDA